MSKKVRIIVIAVVFLLLIPCIAWAAPIDFSNKLVFFEEKQITQQASGNVTVAIGNADIQTDVNGSVIVILGRATVHGRVGGDIVSIFGEVDIENNSSVQGNLVSIGKLKKAENVQIFGTKLDINVDIISLFKSNGIIINGLIILALITLAAGLILISIFPGRYRIMAYRMSSGLSRRMILGGLVVISFTIVVIFLLFMMVAPLLYVLLLMFTDILASIYVGTFIFKSNFDRTTIYLQFFVGHLLISILKIVPLILIPAGSYNLMLVYGICFLILQMLMAFFGVGTIIDTGFGKKTGKPPITQ